MYIHPGRPGLVMSIVSIIGRSSVLIISLRITCITTSSLIISIVIVVNLYIMCIHLSIYIYIYIYTCRESEIHIYIYI